MDQSLLGRELKATLYGCDVAVIDDVDAMRRLVERACADLAVEIRSVTVERFQPQGVSVVAILAESHLALHTWPETGTTAVDVFTCGPTDPTHAVPVLLTGTHARSSDVTLTRREAVHDEGFSRYPGAEEYLLRPTPGGHFPAPTFRRGTGRRYLMEPEAIAWQDFFTSPQYTPPRSKDILLLHPCSWAKPYDMSAFGTRLRQALAAHPRVHRAIVSNVGVVPFEYQMNPFFCSYDYLPAAAQSPDERRSAHEEYSAIVGARVDRYLEARRADYSAVVMLGHPVRDGLWRTVARSTRSHRTPGFLAPSPGTYRQARAEVDGGNDSDAPLFADSSLAELSQRLTQLELKLDTPPATAAHV